jgi:mannose-6-phosphate isomerase-like protein (cupin superfamily)
MGPFGRTREPTGAVTGPLFLPCTAMDEPTAPTPDDDVDAPDAARVRPVDLRDYVDFTTDEARRTRVFTTGRLAHDLWCLEPQQATPVLAYPDVDVTYTVLGGRSWFVTDQGEVGLDPMGALLVPAGVVHGIDNRGADPLIVSAVSAPPDAAAEDAPVQDTGAAIRDDARYGQTRRRIGEALGRLLGR